MLHIEFKLLYQPVNIKIDTDWKGVFYFRRKCFHPVNSVGHVVILGIDTPYHIIHRLYHPVACFTDLCDIFFCPPRIRIHLGLCQFA